MSASPLGLKTAAVVRLSCARKAACFWFLPVLGLWMLPFGLLLIAYDVPFLRKPVGYFTIWGAEKWAAFRLWVRQKRGT